MVFLFSNEAYQQILVFKSSAKDARNFFKNSHLQMTITKTKKDNLKVLQLHEKCGFAIQNYDKYGSIHACI